METICDLIETSVLLSSIIIHCVCVCLGGERRRVGIICIYSRQVTRQNICFAKKKISDDTRGDTNIQAICRTEQFAKQQNNGEQEVRNR